MTMIPDNVVFHPESAFVADIRLGLCLLYTSDAADERSSVDLGGRRIIKKKKSHANDATHELVIEKERRNK